MTVQAMTLSTPCRLHDAGGDAPNAPEVPVQFAADFQERKARREIRSEKGCHSPLELINKILRRHMGGSSDSSMEVVW